MMMVVVMRMVVRDAASGYGDTQPPGEKEPIGRERRRRMANVNAYISLSTRAPTK